MAPNRCHTIRTQLKHVKTLKQVVNSINQITDKNTLEALKEELTFQLERQINYLKELDHDMPFMSDQTIENIAKHRGNDVEKMKITNHQKKTKTIASQLNDISFNDFKNLYNSYSQDAMLCSNLAVIYLNIHCRGFFAFLAFIEWAKSEQKLNYTTFVNFTTSSLFQSMHNTITDSKLRGTFKFSDEDDIRESPTFEIQEIDHPDDKYRYVHYMGTNNTIFNLHACIDKNDISDTWYLSINNENKQNEIEAMDDDGESYTPVLAVVKSHMDFYPTKTNLLKIYSSDTIVCKSQNQTFVFELYEIFQHFYLGVNQPHDDDDMQCNISKDVIVNNILSLQTDDERKKSISFSIRLSCPLTDEQLATIHRSHLYTLYNQWCRAQKLEQRNGTDFKHIVFSGNLFSYLVMEENDIQPAPVPAGGKVLCRRRILHKL